MRTSIGSGALFGYPNLLAGALLGAMASAVPLAAQGAAGGAACGSGGLKFAYVRSQDILDQTPGKTELEAQFKKEVDSAQALEKAWGDTINTMISDFSKAEPTLSTDAKTTRGAAIRERQMQYQQRRQQLEQQLQTDNQRVTGPIIQRVNAVIEQIRTDGCYAFIFDVQAQGGGIVAADKTLDITDRVIATVQALGPVTAGPAGAGAAPAKPAAGPTTRPSGVSRPKTQ